MEKKEPIYTEILETISTHLITPLFTTTLLNI